MDVMTPLLGRRSTADNDNDDEEEDEEAEEDDVEDDGDGAGGAAAGANSSPWVWEPTPSRLFNSGVTLLPRSTYDELTARVAGVDAETREVRACLGAGLCTPTLTPPLLWRRQVREECLRKLASAGSDFAARKASMEEQAARAVALERAKLEELSVRHETYVREATAARDKVEADAARVLQVRLLARAARRPPRPAAATAATLPPRACCPRCCRTPRMGTRRSSLRRATGTTR